MIELQVSIRNALATIAILGQAPSLNDTRLLLVISTPGAFLMRDDGSPNWVQREIDHFLEIASPRRIILALGPGAPQDRFPGRLAEVSERWDWADFREYGWRLWLTPWRLEQLDRGVTKIVARLYDVPVHLLPILLQEQTKRRNRVLLWMTGVAFLLSSALLGLTWVALDQRATARAEARLAEQREATLLAVQARRETSHGNAVNGMLLSLLGLPTQFDPPNRSVVPETVGALMSAMHAQRERMNLVGHTDWVRAASVGSDGKQLATAGDDGSLRLWDIQTGSRRILHADRKERFRFVRFSPDGRRLIAGGFSGNVYLFDTLTARQVWRVKPGTSGANDADFSIDHKYVVVAFSDGRARVYNLTTGLVLTELVGHGKAIEVVRYDPGGEVIATASNDQQIRLWRAADGHLLRILSGHQYSITNLGFDTGGDRLLSASADGTARLWNAHDGTQEFVFAKHSGPVDGAAYSARLKVVVTAGQDGKTLLFSAKDGRLLRKLTETNFGAGPVVFNSDHSLLAIGGNDGSTTVLKTDT